MARKDMNNKSSKCPKCEGHGRIVVKVQDDRYACGFHQEAETCPMCLGSGRKLPVPESPDQKIAAAGGAA